MTSAAFTASFSDEFIEGLAHRVAQLIADGTRSPAGTSSWLDVEGAAEYLCTTSNAIRGMVKRRQVPFHRTPTGRLLFDRCEVNAWVRAQRDEGVDADPVAVLRSEVPNKRPGAVGTAPARHQEVKS